MKQRLPPFGDRRRRRIGLLGGSFNPAHAGHLHMSRAARRALGLHDVWWLVSPQNPLKPATGMAALHDRMARARAVARGDALVTDVECRLGTTRTLATLRALHLHYPCLRFVWLMGADNLAQMPRWWRWRDIPRTVRVAVFDRAPYSYAARFGAAACLLRNALCSTRRIWHRPLPAWTWVAIRRHPASATAIRAGRAAS